MLPYSKVLVTGGAGFIGSHLVDRLLADDVEVIALDNMHSGRLENIEKHLKQKNFRFVKGDVRDAALVKELLKNADAVLHQAALVSVPESVKNPLLTNDVNVNGTLNLLTASIDYDIKRFVYASSCAIYGDAKSMPVNEECPAKPISPYGVSKLAAENYVRVFHEVFGLEAVCLRYFNVYGERQDYNQYSGVITQFMKRLSTNSPIVIFGDGKQTRDFVHVQDVVTANLQALNSEKAVGEVLNVATGVPASISQLASTLLDLADKAHLGLAYTKPQKGDIQNSCADLSKSREKLGYSPRISLREGLSRLLEEQGLLRHNA